jgi:hypothetical protein
MSNPLSKVASVVVSFAPRSHHGQVLSHLGAGQSRTTCLTARDRIDVTRWQDRARQCGYDRMVIHDRDALDDMDVGNFLSVYRSGEAWSRWGFVRDGAIIRSWCCLSGADVGEFESLSDSLESVLLGAPVRRAPAASVVQLHRAAAGVVTEVGSRFGSAA